MLQAVAEHYGIVSPLIPKIATGFCGGMGRTKNVCGAVSGGIMAIGIFFGREYPDDAPDHAYSRVQEFQRIFKQRYGTVNCFELTGCDLSTVEGRQYFREHVKGKCQGYTGSAARIVAEIIGPVEAS